MNRMGRQGQRERYGDGSLSNGRWLQSAGLQSLYSNSSAPQDYGFSVGGGGGQGLRMYRNAHGNFGGLNECYMEPSNPPEILQHKSREDAPSDLSPGLLDLQ